MYIVLGLVFSGSAASEQNACVDATVSNVHVIIPISVCCCSVAQLCLVLPCSMPYKLFLAPLVCCWLLRVSAQLLQQSMCN